MKAYDLLIPANSRDIPEFSITTNRTIKAGSHFHLWTPSFRLFFRNTVERFELAGRAPESLLHVKDDPCGHKKSFREVKAMEDIPAGSSFLIKIAVPSDKGLNLFGDIDLELGLVAFDEDAYKSDICRFPVHPYAPPFRIYVSATTPSRLEAYRRFNNDIYVRLADDKGATATPPSGDKPLTVSVRGKSIPLDPKGLARFSLPSDDADCFTITTNSGLSAAVNPLPQAPDIGNVYFGDIHWHTEMSTDGARSLVRALRTCRDELGLDFAGCSEHVLGEGDFGRSDVHDLIRVYRDFDQPGQFATIPGFEISRQYGHCNVYVKDFETLIRLANRFPEELSPSLKRKHGAFGTGDVVRLLEDGDSIVVPHHTNMDNAAGKGQAGTQPAWSAYHWPREPYPQHLRLMEMNQQRGSFETEIPDTDWQPPFWKNFRGGLGGSAQTALAKGHRIGFTGGTDNHFGWPTLDGNHGMVGGITGVVAADLSKESIVKALHARSCYATTGARMVAHATLNEVLFGSELKLNLTDPRSFKISIKGTAPLERVEIVSFQQVAHAFHLSGTDTSFEGVWNDDRPERAVEEVHYYVRARQVDGHCLWISPWWIDLA
jgi:hypothetical protein